MFKIGEFSKLSQVTVKTLRHYDEEGLLKPAQVDRFTGYRYYSADQLPRLYRILALKDLGLSLQQIGRFLTQDLPTSELRGMLRLKQVEIQEQIEAEQLRLRRVAARLRQLEQEESMPNYEVVIKDVPAMRVAALRGIIPSYAAQGELWGELEGHLAQRGIKPTGPCLTVYYDEEYKERDVDVELCEPVDAERESGPRVQVQDLPAATMASLVLHGSYDQFTEAYGALMQWIQANGYRIVGPNREIYIRSHDDVAQPDDLVTEIQFPVMKA